ncbi:MAG: gliding motility-associated C-terminal domain-containing protein [Bacteroidota bacterium]
MFCPTPFPLRSLTGLPCLLLLLLLAPAWSGAQDCCNNLVPNGSFETFSALPNDDCDWFLATGWTNAAASSECNSRNGTPDYFHRNGTGPFSTLPDNTFANGIEPQDGDAVMGILTYSTVFFNAREYLSTELECPLTVGESYTLRLFVSRGANPILNTLATNQFGAYLSETPVQQPVNTNQPIDITPTFVVNEVIEDRDWREITFSFTADRVYRYLTLGNFADDYDTNVEVVDGPGSAAYYFVDNISLVNTSSRLSVNLGPDQDLCADELILDAGIFTGATYQWSTGAVTQTITVEQSGTYGVTVTGDCAVGEDEIAISLNSPERILRDEVICEGEQLELNGEVYTATGTYFQTIPGGGASGCDLIITLNLTAAPPSVRDTAITICPGESLLLNGETFSDPGTYQQFLPGQDVNGCDLTLNLTLDVEVPSSLDTLVLLCAGERFTLDGTTYDRPGNFEQLVAGASANGCALRYRIEVQTAEGSLSLPDLVEARLGATVQLVAEWRGNNDLESLSWSPAEGLSCTDCLDPELTAINDGTYQLLATDQAACTYSVTVQLRVVPQVDLYLPNAFSPNEDGANDRFFPQGNPEGIATLGPLTVFDRWGAVVYQRDRLALNEVNEGWDGRYGGRDLQVGVYTYLLRVQLINGEMLTFSGDISLFR